MIGSLSVLIVGVPPVASDVVRSLQALGHHDVQTVGSFSAGLQAFLARDFRLVITEEVIGEETGLELIEEIMVRWGVTPAVIVSQGDFSSTPDLMFSNIDWIGYPFDAWELADAINSVTA